MKKLIVTALASLLLSSTAMAQDTVGKVIQIKEVKKGVATDLQYQRKGEAKWFAGYVDLQGRLHDKFKTDANTVAAIEFLIGGRVGINKDSEIEIVTERSVSDAKNVKRIILRKGGMWAKAANLKEPLEIQTNGGVMGIKGTEFVIDTQPGGDTSVAVLEGAVEVKDNSGKVVGQAKPGDKYVLPYKGVPVVKSYEPQTLREELQNSSSWNDFNQALNIVNMISSWAGYVGGVPVLSSIGYYGGAVSALASVDFERDPAGAISTGIYAANVAGVNTGPVGGYVGMAGGFMGGGKKEPKKPPFPVNLSPDSSGQSKTERTAKSAPVFKWDAVDGVDGYVVLVSPDEKFEDIEWSARARDGKGLAYPANAQPLKAGKHYWRVICVDENDKPVDDKKGAQTFFEVVP